MARERLNPEAVVKAIAESGRPAFYEPDVAHILERLVPLLKAKDVVVIFSNGGFDGIHGKLLAALANRFQERVQRLEQLLLDLDVADSALAVALLQIFDFRLIRIEHVVVGENRIALDRADRTFADR